jgi:hypothetical protein
MHAPCLYGLCRLSVLLLFVRKGAGQQRVDYGQETGRCIVARDRRMDEARKLFAVPALGEVEQIGQ